MPELPELERARRHADRVLVGRTITRVGCARDAIVFAGVTPARIQRALRGRQVVAAHRRGKYLWLELDRRPWPLFHFGMTGGFHSPAEASLDLESTRAEPERDWPPRFTKIHLWTDDGGELVMTNARRFGRIRLYDDPTAEPPVSKLGFDPLIDLPGAGAFAAALRKRTAPIKGVLLDQGFAAGVGNWIADEILFQARIAPHRPANTLDAREAGRVRTKMKSIVERAVAVDADKSRFPRTWLFHRRWGKQAGATMPGGAPIVHVTIAGRTTAWVPSRQG